MPPGTRAQAGQEPGAAGDREAFERYREALRAYAYARVRDWEAAEDLAQETLIRAVQSRRTPDDPAEIPRYLRRILKNLCINFARDSRPTVSLALTTESDDGARESAMALSQLIARAAEEQFLEQDARRRIFEAIEQLPKRLREVVVMRCLDGLSYAEMGRFLGIKPQTINWRLHKARQLLTEELEMRIEEPTRGPLSCRQCRRLLSPFIDGELEFPEVRRVHQHLHECERCTEELDRLCEQIRQVDLALASEANAERILRHSSPRVWQKAWELLKQRMDSIAQDEEQTLRAMHAFGVPGLTAEQLELFVALARACVEANPDSPKAFDALGRVHIRHHDYEAAQAAFESEIELARRLADPVRARRCEASGFEGLRWVWDHLARQAERAGEQEAARAAAERVVEYGSQAIELDPDNDPNTQGSIVEWLAWLGREEEALREIQRYLQTMEAAAKPPEYGSLGRGLWLLGRREEALECHQRWLAASPLHPWVLRQVAQMYEWVGQSQEAAFWRARAEAMRRTSGRQTVLPPA